MIATNRAEGSKVTFEYLKAVGSLTVNEDNRLRLQLEKEKENNQKQLEKIVLSKDVLH
jgi:hypothetical protein